MGLSLDVLPREKEFPKQQEFQERRTATYNAKSARESPHTGLAPGVFPAFAHPKPDYTPARAMVRAAMPLTVAPPRQVVVTLTT
jgi:hypothetical protein